MQNKQPHPQPLSYGEGEAAQAARGRGLLLEDGARRPQSYLDNSRKFVFKKERPQRDIINDNNSVQHEILQGHSLPSIRGGESRVAARGEGLHFFVLSAE